MFYLRPDVSLHTPVELESCAHLQGGPSMHVHLALLPAPASSSRSTPSAIGLHASCCPLPIPFRLGFPCTACPKWPLNLATLATNPCPSSAHPPICYSSISPPTHQLARQPIYSPTHPRYASQLRHPLCLLGPAPGGQPAGDHRVQGQPAGADGAVQAAMKGRGGPIGRPREAACWAPPNSRPTCRCRWSGSSGIEAPSTYATGGLAAARARVAVPGTGEGVVGGWRRQQES